MEYTHVHLICKQLYMYIKCDLKFLYAYSHKFIYMHTYLCVYRECIRSEGWTESVHLKRRADHFIFSVEAVGVITPVEDIVMKVSVVN